MIFYSPDIAPTAVCVGDIDGDNDEDILSFFDQKFRLYLHSDGNGSFVEHEIIIDTLDWVLSVHISDLNNDGKQDILAASYNNDKIIWYENLGGISFGLQKTICDSISGACSVYAADLDNDGDQDVISASLWDNKIAWYENQGGGLFGEQEVITSLAEGARYVYVADLNKDGLQDVLSASIYDNIIAWHENQGGGLFGERQVISNSVARPLCVYTDDLNGDGHQDVLSASAWDNKIAWYENDGQGDFGVQQVISNALDRAQSVYSADLDGDGDQDVLSASLLDNKIAWYENMGTGVFGVQRVVTNSADMPGFVYATDIDGDGYKDILSASTDFKIAWYENTLPMNITGNPKDTAIYPGKNAEFRIAADFATGYLWQCSNGDGFIDLSNSGVYSGVSTNTLEITGASFDLQGNNYRCVTINGQDSLNSPAALLTIIDTISPSIHSVHPDTLLQTDAYCIALIPDYTASVLASDNSNGPLHVSQDPVPWSKLFGAGEELTLTVSDEAGNSTYVTFHVDVQDLLPPVFDTPLTDKELVYENGHFILPDFADKVDISDNCSDQSSISISQDPEPYYVLPDTVFSVSVTLNATDAAGNTSYLSFETMTIDILPPVITSTHSDIEIEGNYQCVAYLPDFIGEVEAIDNFDEFSELSITQVPDAYTVISGSDNMVNLSVTDKAGNVSEVTFNVEVSFEKPAIYCIQDQYLDLQQGQMAYTVSGYEFDPTAFEVPCGYGSMTNNINDSVTLKHVEFSQDTTQVIWTITDAAGNISQCNFNVILNKTIGIETFLKSGISVYPNPTTGELFIESSKPVQQIRILDLKGRVMMYNAEIPEKGCINMNDFRRGTYILNIVTDKRVHNMKIFKE